MTRARVAEFCCTLLSSSTTICRTASCTAGANVFGAAAAVPAVCLAPAPRPVPDLLAAAFFGLSVAAFFGFSVRSAAAEPRFLAAAFVACAALYQSRSRQSYKHAEISKNGRSVGSHA